MGTNLRRSSTWSVPKPWMVFLTLAAISGRGLGAARGAILEVPLGQFGQASLIEPTAQCDCVAASECCRVQRLNQFAGRDRTVEQFQVGASLACHNGVDYLPPISRGEDVIPFVRFHDPTPQFVPMMLNHFSCSYSELLRCKQA